MIDLIVEQNGFEILGQCPQALLQVFDIFKDKVNVTRIRIEEYEIQKEQLKEVEALHETIRDLQLEIDRLVVFQENYEESQKLIKLKEKEIQTLEKVNSELIPLKQEKMELLEEMERVKYQIEEDKLRIQALQSDLEIAKM